tara:strand:+ start:35 stop:379 length:345 start_codon:yes stop_codon:yes gene_type:complete
MNSFYTKNENKNNIVINTISTEEEIKQELILTSKYGIGISKRGDETFYSVMIKRNSKQLFIDQWAIIGIEIHDNKTVVSAERYNKNTKKYSYNNWDIEELIKVTSITIDGKKYI